MSIVWGQRVNFLNGDGDYNFLGQNISLPVETDHIFLEELDEVGNREEKKFGRKPCVICYLAHGFRG